MRKGVYLFFLSILVYSSGDAQVGTLAMTPSPLSPDAAGLGKFVEVPVGHYNGTPNISVPIYSLQGKGVSLPVFLSYNASGIKVREVGGSVGLGWSINNGGVITRVVRCYPDDHDPSPGPGALDPDDSMTVVSRQRIKANHHGNGADFETGFTEAEKLQILASSPRGEVDPSYDFAGVRWDTEIDHYYFNFSGHTGQFTFTNEGAPLLLTGNQLKIEYINRKFKITDAQGTQYFFDTTESIIDRTTSISYYDGGGRLYTSAWHLSKIHNPTTNETILFSYKQFENYYIYHPDYQVLASSATRVDRLTYSTGPISTGCPRYQREYFPDSYEFGYSLFLDEINFDDKKIKFYGDTTRTDLFKYKIDSMKVTYNSQSILKTTFGYSYFNAGSSDVSNRRLRLDSVSTSDQTYRFKYIDSVHGKGIPQFMSQGQDLWGYYNGEDDRGQVIPNYKVFEYWPDTNVFNYIAGINSTVYNPDYKYAQIGTLQSIQYPTGGKTFFEYEGNDYSKFPFVTEGYNIETDGATQLIFDSSSSKGSSALTDGELVQIINYDQKFVIHKDQTVQIRTTIGMDTTISYDEYLWQVMNIGSWASVSLSRYNENNGNYEAVDYFEVYPIDSIGWPVDEAEYLQLRDNANAVRDRSLFLTEGQYRIRINLEGYFLFCNYQVINKFPYKKSNGVYNAGGLRIKKISFISGTDADSSFVKNYGYATDTLSSGVLESPFSNFTSSFILGPETAGTSEDIDACSYADISSNPVIPLGNANGGVIGYGKVTETREDGSKTIYHYTTGDDDPELMADNFASPNADSYRTRAWTDNSWKRGLSKRTQFYNSSNQLIRENFCDYDFVYNYLGDSSISMVCEKIIPFSISQQYFGWFERTVNFLERMDRHPLKIRDSTISYNPGGNLLELTKYEYAINPYAHPIKITYTNSLGEQLITHRKHPMDYDPGHSPFNNTAYAVRNLLDKHVIAPVIENYIEKKDAGGSNARVIAGQYVRYKTTVSLPDSIFQLQLTGPITNFTAATITSTSSTKDSRYKPSVIFQQYDNYGGVTEQSKANDSKEVLLWGYKHQYVVARIVGSNYSTVLSLVDTSILNNPSSESALLTELNDIRTGLAGSVAQVYSYAYKPLVGITAMVDAAGRKTSYEYDSQGRLWLIKDQDGNIIKKICYNYSGKAENCN